MKTLKFKEGILKKPAIKPALSTELTYIDPQDVKTGELPTARVSKDEAQTLTQMLRELTAELGQADSKFPLEFLELMQTLSLVNPDVSQMVDNIVQLGNTGHHVLIEADTDSQKEQILEEINSFQKSVFQRFGGADGFVNSLLAQVARGGAGSVEWVVAQKLDGLLKAVFVPLESVRFVRDEKNDDYHPYQKFNNIGVGKEGWIELNTNTYQYCSMQLLDNSPYAVPPILAALEAIMIQRDIVKNFKMVAKKMGVLGFISFLITAPKQKPGESEEKYATRLQNYVDQQSEALKKNFNNGISVGYKGNLEVKIDSLASNATGAKEIHQTVEELVFSGLKADPALHGRTYSTTETYAGVVYEKMLSILSNYQRVVRQILSYGYQLHLTLKGFKYKEVYVEFEVSKSLTAERDESTYGQKLLNLEKLYDQGVISQEQYAQEAGYDNPDLEEPRVPRGGGLFPVLPEVPEDAPIDESANHLSKGAHRTDRGVPLFPERLTVKKPVSIRLDFDRKVGRYKLFEPKKTRLATHLNYSDALEESAEPDDDSGIDQLFEMYWGKSLLGEHSGCGCRIDASSLALSDSGKALKRYAASYFRAVYPTMKGARNAALRDVNRVIDKLDGQGLDSEEFARVVYNKLVDSFGEKLENSALADKIRKNINNTYKFFRLLDKEPFGGDFPVKPSFEQVDRNAVRFMRNSDEFYFGKYVDDPETKKALTQFIKDDYLKNGRSIRDPGELQAFKKRFGDKVAQQDYKIVRVVETSASRAKNWGNALNSHQSKARTLKIRGPKDNLTCPWCSSMVGKEFKAAPVVSHIKDTIARDPSDLPQLSPFLVGKMSPAQARELSPDQLLAQGIALPPYHPHCRHQFTVSSFDGD